MSGTPIGMIASVAGKGAGLLAKEAGAVGHAVKGLPGLLSGNHAAAAADPITPPPPGASVAAGAAAPSQAAGSQQPTFQPRTPSFAAQAAAGATDAMRAAEQGTPYAPAPLQGAPRTGAALPPLPNTPNLAPPDQGQPDHHVRDRWLAFIAGGPQGLLQEMRRQQALHEQLELQQQRQDRGG